MPPMLIAPSILAADFARLGDDVNAALQAGADIVHFDVMDNHYVPNLSVGPLVLEALRKYGITAPLDVHLMVQPVDPLIEAFARAGASWITFHPEASQHVHRSLSLIRSLGCKAGLVLNPGTPVDLLNEVLPLLDVVLVMSVNPGFGGQSFIASSLDKLRRVKQLLQHAPQEVRLEIDGGIKIDNIGPAALAGADTFVAGSAIFGAASYSDAITAMRAALQAAQQSRMHGGATSQPRIGS